MINVKNILVKNINVLTCIICSYISKVLLETLRERIIKYDKINSISRVSSQFIDITICIIELFLVIIRIIFLWYNPFIY